MMDSGRQADLQEAAVGLSVAMCQAVGDAAALAEAAKVAEAIFEDVNHFSIALLTPDGSNLKFFRIRSDPTNHRQLGIQEVSMTAAGCCVTFKDVVKVDNITASPSKFQDFGHVHDVDECVAFVCAPIILAGKAIGAITIASQQAGAFAGAEQAALILASTIAPYFGLKRFGTELKVMDAFVQQMVPMRVAVHLAQKQARALRGSTPLTSSSAGAGIAAFVTGISAAAHAAAGTATAPAGAAAAAPTAPAAAAAVPSAPVGSEGQVAPSGSLSSQHRALAPAPAPHNHPPGSPPRHLATNQAGPSSSVAGTSAPAQPVVGAPAAPRGATVAGRSGAVVSVPRLSPLMTFSSTATEAHYLQQQGTSTRGQLLDGAFAAFLLFSLCCVHPHILRAGGAAAGAALLLPLLLAALPATWFHQRGYVDAREAAVATARLWRALLLAWQLLAGWGPWQQQVTSLLPSKSDSPAWQLLCWLFVISAAALAAALAAACVAGAAPRRSSARRPGLCLGAAAAGALAVVLAAAASAHASTSLWLAGQAVQQPWLLLVLMPLLGRTRLCLHLLLQTACLLPVLLATRFAASVQALGAAAAAAAGQQASGGASSSGSSSSSGTLLAAQWPEVLHLDASLEVALQLVLGFLLVSVLLHFQEVRSRYQYARRMRSA